MDHVELYEVGDVARRRGRSSATVRGWADTGRLKIFAVTPRGTRLFLPADVEALRLPAPRIKKFASKEEGARSAEALENSA
jgi:DNA-binding transcriptional MerR regulator